MDFTRLRLTGFKSFVESVDFLIEPGLTGVVGPNGCGKSNLSDALRWVMGESSYKNMRASEMEDVIFSGSGNRPARQSAEVAIAIDNSSRKAPAAFNDADVIEITRRIERDAGSVYRVNGREVRARDVQLLFADASTGAHSPAMVGQGRVGELIAARPQARRAIIEEAAGISGLHARRHEAELRLRSAEQNLERVEDVLREIEVRLDALKRQSRQATRYKGLSAEIRKIEATAFFLRWVAAGNAVREAEAALAAATTRVEEEAVRQAATARDQAVAAAALPALRDRAAAASAAVQRIVLESQQLDGEERRVGERLAELKSRITQADDDIRREQQIAADHADVMTRLAAEETRLRADEENAAPAEAKAAEAASAAEARLTEAEAASAEAMAALADLKAKRYSMQRAVDAATARAGRSRSELQSLAREIEQVTQSQAASAARLETSRASVADAERVLAEVEQRATSSEGERIRTAEAEVAARKTATESERALAAIEAERRALGSLLRRTEEADPILDRIEVEPEYERALAAAFGDDLDAPADPEAPLHWREVPPASDDPALPEGADPLAARVQAPVELWRRLTQTGIVEPADGLRLQAQLKPGQRLVSRAGDLWRWDGFVATADAPTAAAERLANRNRLAALDRDADGLRQKAGQDRATLDAATAAARSAVTAEQDARKQVRDARAKLDLLRTALSALERDGLRDAARSAAIVEAKSRLESAIAEADVAVAETRSQLVALPDPAEREAAMATLRENASVARARVVEARLQLDGIRRASSGRKARLSGIATERRAWQDRGAKAETQIAALRQRKTEASAELETLSERPLAIAAERRGLLAASATAETERSAALEALNAGEAAEAEAGKLARTALQDLSTAREERGRAEERLNAAGERRAEVERRIGETLECQPQDLAALAGLGEAGVLLPELSSVETKLERLREERERLGGVNLQAEEEATEVGDRRETLISERDDLIAAIHRLRQAIVSLNTEGRERLLSAFQVVNGHFQRLFTHLFGGGTAELLLTESDDPLQAGLEIMARPPGKRPQTMTLLSGGEQALTAMALIFAVFLTNPAPICVLDEVDAPLDDANVERLCNLLDEMTRSTRTRFVVITHHPITMSRMTRLFGVTMAERGVSQLVSVDLATAERFREVG